VTGRLPVATATVTPAIKRVPPGIGPSPRGGPAPTVEGERLRERDPACAEPAAAQGLRVRGIHVVHLVAGGTVGHAEIRIGDSVIMLADEFPEMGHRAPQPGSGAPVFVMLYVEDVDRTWRKAIAAGGQERQPLQDQFYGDRSGTLVDPFGHTWTIATHQEDVSPEEMKRRSEAAMKAAPKA
jgi:uncharacterized glyoxalase superfamily protein PhnB